MDFVLINETLSSTQNEYLHRFCWKCGKAKQQKICKTHISLTHGAQNKHRTGWRSSDLCCCGTKEECEVRWRLHGPILPLISRNIWHDYADVSLALPLLLRIVLHNSADLISHSSSSPTKPAHTLHQVMCCVVTQETMAWPQSHPLTHTLR